MKQELKHSMPTIVRNGERIHGGNQAWLPWKYMQRGGCGTIAGTDFLLYLNMYRRGCRTEVFEELPVREEEFTFEEYCSLVDRMRKSYFPILPFLGMSGWSLAIGMNLYFHKYHLPYRAYWAVRPKLMWKFVEGMLRADIPVPMTVGQNVPFFFMKHKLNFYAKAGDGSMYVARKVKAHFVTITGIDEEWIRITSWGKEFFIRKKEYEEYTRRHSCMLVSNILLLRRVDR